MAESATIPASTTPESRRARPALLSVVTPVYGCAACLEELVDRILRAVGRHCESVEILLVDDASPDQAWNRIREIASRVPCVRGIRLSRNFGQHYAIAAGIESAHGDWIVVMDCDLQDAPEELPRLLDAAGNGHDIVFAQRVDRQDTLFKRFTSFAFYRFLSYLTEVKYDHSIANFGVFSRKVIDTVNRMPESDRFFPLMVKWTGFKTATVPVVHAERPHGKSSYEFGKLVRLALNVVLSYSDKPLRLVVKLGLLFSLVSLVLAFTSVYRYLLGDIAVAGFTSVIASIWLIGSVTISCIGIAGLYIGRLFNNAKGRPYYVISEEISSTEPEA